MFNVQLECAVFVVLFVFEVLANKRHHTNNMNFYKHFFKVSFIKLCKIFILRETMKEKLNMKCRVLPTFCLRVKNWHSVRKENV